MFCICATYTFSKTLFDAGLKEKYPNDKQSSNCYAIEDKETPVNLMTEDAANVTSHFD